MTKDEALKLALEALEKADRHCPVNTEAEVFVRLSITVLREELAEPEQEPVQKPAAVVSSCTGAGDKGVRVKWLGGFPQIGDRLYTTPPAQRPWVGLTDEERDEICLGDESIARAIEAKLKEKNK